MRFHSPFVFLLLPLAVFLIVYAAKKSSPGVRFSSTDFFNGLKTSFRVRLSRWLVFLRVIAVGLLIAALARLQTPLEEVEVKAEGIDIVLAIDCSTSMLARDFKLKGKQVDRLDAVKAVVEDFISKRQSDRIGIVAFAGRAYTVCPLTLDYGWLLKNLKRIQAGMIEDGTAIGSGISSSLNRLRNTPAKGKVVILLTDGVNNAGKISPLTAAEAAAALGIKIYTIGVGTRGMAPYPVKDLFGNTVYQPVKIEIDEEVLKKIARISGAQYYRAADTESLRKIYQEIDKLETAPIEEKGYAEYKELFGVFLIPGIVFLLLEIILSNTVLRKNP